MSEDLTVTISVEATPQQAFDAINDVSGWWGRITGTTTTVGDEFVYVVPGLHYAGFRVTELQPAQAIQWAVTGSYLGFIADQQEWTSTTVRFALAATDTGTDIVFTHTGLRPEVECFEVCSTAWGTYLRGSLKDLIETGVGRPNTFEGNEPLAAADHADIRRRIEVDEPARMAGHG